MGGGEGAPPFGDATRERRGSHEASALAYLTGRPAKPTLSSADRRSKAPEVRHGSSRGSGRQDQLRGSLRTLGARQLEVDQARLHRGPREWHELFTEFEREAALWNYSLFFHGEDSVADNLSPYIDAAPREEQKYFLATQQVDEARHAVFFGRFMREVVERGDAHRVVARRHASQLTWGFRKLFARLDHMADELRRDRSRPKLAQAVSPSTTSSSRRRSPSRASTSSTPTSTSATCSPASGPG